MGQRSLLRGGEVGAFSRIKLMLGEAMEKTKAIPENKKSGASSKVLFYYRIEKTYFNRDIIT